MAKYLMIQAPVGEVGFGCAAVDGVQGADVSTACCLAASPSAAPLVPLNRPSL